VDASTKSDSNAWRYIVNFLRSVVSSFRIDSNCVRVAVIRYADRADVTIRWNQYNDVNGLLSGVQLLTLLGGGSNLATALQAFQTLASGSARSGARLVAGIVTDRLTCNQQITSLATSLKNQYSATIAGIAVTRTGAVQSGCLGQFVSPNLHAEITDYSQLNAYVSRIAQFLCVSTAPGPGPGPGPGPRPNLQPWGKRSTGKY